MCDQTEISYLDGDVVWVKLGSCWWPGEVVGSEKLPPDVLPSFRKPPIAVVKFFQENTYEYVKNINSIYKYNCSRKKEFINKGLYMYRTKHGHMEKFPEDVIRAETAVGGDIEILTRDEFQEVKKEKSSYAGIFGDTPRKIPVSGKKGRGARGRPASESPKPTTPIRKFMKEKSDYKVHILLQTPVSKESANQSTETASTPSTSRAGSETAEDKPQKVEQVATSSTPASAAQNVTTPTVSSSGIYSCPSCSFSTSRLNVLILHNKSHSATFPSYTPSPTVIRKKTISKPKSTPKTPKTQKTPRPRKEKLEKVTKKSSQGKKRSAEEKPENAVVKKAKTDEEIKSSLLADWDDMDEDSNDESGMIMSGSPEVPVGAESPAVPTPAELPSAQVPRELSSPVDKKSEGSTSTEKPEASVDCKYDFCEDEDWLEEADVGRKIPRVKNPSKRKEDTKSISIDEDEVAKEVAELLNKTTLPELPSVPEPLKVEENFPEPSIVKSPDKKSENSSELSKTHEKTDTDKKITKAIFKTKTFFRSRHSRSQDAIGKYVAEQLNAAERMDMTESELNGSEVASSPEARESPPVDCIKVARLAPKIQLKKMKAEAAQLREKEKSDNLGADSDASTTVGETSDSISDTPLKFVVELESSDTPLLASKALQDVLYPTQEIKPINKEKLDKFHYREDPKSENRDTTNNAKGLDCDVNKNLSDKSPETISEIYSGKSSEETIEMPNKFIQISSNKIDDNSTEQPELINDATNLISEDSTKITLHVDTLPVISEPKTNEQVMEVKEKESIDLSTIQHEIETEVREASLQESTKKSFNQVSPQKSYEMSHEKPKYTQELNVINIEPQLEISSPGSKLNEQTPQKSCDQLMQPYMNESTASAVDALLSVSRETDRQTVPRIVSDDLPEDLFEDDVRDSSINNDTIENNDGIPKGSSPIEAPEMGHVEEREIIQKINEVHEDQTDYNLNGKTTQGEQDATNENVLSEDIIPLSTEDSTKNNIALETVVENVPSESDLQIAEALINLPSTALQNKPSNELQETVPIPMLIDNDQGGIEIMTTDEEKVILSNKTCESDESLVNTEPLTEPVLIPKKKNLSIRYETEQEKSENLNAAQSLVQMSETIEHKINIVDEPSINMKDVSNVPFSAKQNNGINTVEQKVALLSGENNSDASNGKSPKFETTSSKLLKILEEPGTLKPFINKTTPVKQPSPLKQVIVSGKEKILNFDVAKSSLKGKVQQPKQKIIIRRAGSSKSFINNLNDVVSSPDKIILSRSNIQSQDGSSVQTFTIQASPDIQPQTDAKQLIIQPKIRKLAKASPKLTKTKPQNSIVTPLIETKTLNEIPTQEEPMFDINSMPVVLSDDILTPENIEKMPIVMSDGNVITNTPNPPKLIKTKPTIIENEKVTASPVASKPEVKTLLINPASDGNKVTTPNILSKSSKLRGAKPMLVIDKATGKQKIIMTKAEPSVKEIKPSPTLLHPAPQTTAKSEKFIILPTASSPRAGRTQKIVIDPQTGKAHVLVAKGQDPQLSLPDNKPVSAKLIPSSSDANTPGNTVMIITNAQGAQSRIVLTPEHEKILFPNKQQQPNMSQLKTITHRISTNTAVTQKSIVSATAVKTQTRIVPKQKSAIITSKGQLIVGGRVASTAQNIAPMPEIRALSKTEIRPAPKRILATEPKKLVQAIQKNTSEPLIFLQQKSGAVMQLTAAQFEHLQRTGQIIQKVPAPAPTPVTENKIIVQKSITIPPKESTIPTIQKQRVRKTAVASPTPAKKVKRDIGIAPILSSAPMPPLTSLSNTIPSATAQTMSSIVSGVSNTVSINTTPSYPDLENFEEMLPSTAIARQTESVPAVHPQEPVVLQPQLPQPPSEPTVAEPPPAQLSDGQLLAVPGESFGGPPGSFYLCVEDNGTLTPIDNRPLVLENNQLVPMALEPVPVFAQQPERRDILEAALANSDVFHAETPRDEAPDFRDLNANVSVHCRVSETSTTLNQPIMTPVEVPSKGETEPAVPSNLEDGLAVIGVTPHTVPTSLELPITVTDPRIAPKTTDPLSSSNYGTSLMPSPNTEMTFVTTEEVSSVGPISMPLLTDEESVGKSMPILTDEVTERTVSSVESTIGSPSSLDVRESENEDGGQWTRRLLTPGSDTSETSAEIPLQPSIQLSVNELSRHS